MQKNSKWIKDLNIRPETIKLLEEKVGKTLSDINHSRILYDPPPRVLEIKTKISKWDLIKLKRFCTAKETMNKMKTQSSVWENIFANEETNRGLISKMYILYKQCMQLNITHYERNANQNYNKISPHIGENGHH